MNKKQIQTIKKNLDEQIIDTQNKINEYTKLCQPIPPENAIGRVSRMDAINNRSVNEAALRQLEKQVKGLEDALQRLGEDKFGRCVSCGEKIPLGRIIIMPGAIRCVRCS